MSPVPATRAAVDKFPETIDDGTPVIRADNEDSFQRPVSGL